MAYFTEEVKPRLTKLPYNIGLAKLWLTFLVKVLKQVTDASTEMFYNFNTMAADDLAPCLARPSAAVVLQWTIGRSLPSSSARKYFKWSPPNAA